MAESVRTWEFVYLDETKRIQCTQSEIADHIDYHSVLIAIVCVDL